MFDVDELEDKSAILAPRLEGAKDEVEVRKILMKSLVDISKMRADEWEIEKLHILSLKVIAEGKLDKLRKLASKDLVVVDDEEAKAKEKLSRIYCSASGKGFSYLLLQDSDLRPIPQQEMTPIIKFLAGEDQLLESSIYEDLHSKREIKKITTHIMPQGKNHFTMEKMDGGGFEAVCHVSIGEMIRNQLRKTDHYKIDPKFEAMVRKEYAYMIDIYEYALALKFAFDKTNCLWVRENSDTGKTFFLGATEAKEYIFITDGAIKENDFVGDGPDKWGKMLFFYIDEATKFSSDMKTAYLAYRMNYGGRVELDMPLRILASDNEITDLTNGVDKQIDNRIINIHYKGKMNLRKWLDDHVLDATTAQMMWQKIILNHVLDLLDSWSKGDNLQKEASKKIVAFKKKYKRGELVGLDETARSLLGDFLVDVCDENGQIKNADMGRVNFREYVVFDDGYYIKKPKAFFSIIFDEYKPEKKKAFFKKYPTNDAIAKIFDTEYKNRRFGDQQGRAIFTSQLHVFDGSM